MTGWRALRAAPRGRFLTSRMAQEGFEPSASLGLNESGLPVAYRAGQDTGSHRVSFESSGSEYPGWDSNPQAPGFKPGRSTDWRTWVSPPASPEAAVAFRGGSRGLELTSGLRRHLFSRQAPDPAGWLPTSRSHTSQFRGLESNQRPPRSERGVATNSNYPGVCRKAMFSKNLGVSTDSHILRALTRFVRVFADSAALC